VSVPVLLAGVGSVVVELATAELVTEPLVELATPTTRSMFEVAPAAMPADCVQVTVAPDAPHDHPAVGLDT
jgi:hypothetical protein